MLPYTEATNLSQIIIFAFVSLNVVTPVCKLNLKLAFTRILHPKIN
jgi:hypothetical protein